MEVAMLSTPEEVINRVDEEKQRAFYESVRETIISLLLVVLLYLLSYWLVAKFKRHRTREDYYSGEEDAMVYRVATWLCSIAVCISLGSAMLLPLSILVSEVWLHYPSSRYIVWLNTSLIPGLWNQVFLGCNLSLFLFLPFAFFFTESEGLAGSKKGLMSRVYETLLLVFLLMLMLIMMVALLVSFFSQNDRYSFSWWLSYFPLLYSLVSMVGVALMVVTTPLGFSALFTVLGDIITRPIIRTNVVEELEVMKFEESSIRRRGTLEEGVARKPSRIAMEEGANLEHLLRKRRELERRLHSSPWERNCLYPLCFLLLLLATLLALLLVAINVFRLLIYPAHNITVQEYLLLGNQGSSLLGAMGALLEAGLIIYFLCASVVGVYSTPWLTWLLPTRHDTPMTKIIANCMLLLVLSSALPLLAWTLGITQFGLLGYFRELEWLRSGWLLLCYNVLFFTITCTILSNRVTRSIMREVSKLLGSRLDVIWRIRSRWHSHKDK